MTPKEQALVDAVKAVDKKMDAILADFVTKGGSPITNLIYDKVVRDYAKFLDVCQLNEVPVEQLRASIGHAFSAMLLELALRVTPWKVDPDNTVVFINETLEDLGIRLNEALQDQYGEGTSKVVAPKNGKRFDA